MIRRSAEQTIFSLAKEGYRFRSFSLQSEGEYAIDDADWNYKDIPHLEHVHHLVNGVPTIIGDEFIASILVQRVFGLSVPLCLVSYESSKSPLIQTYYVSWLWFILIIETQYQTVARNRTRVITTYHVGTPRLLQWAFPFVRYALTRNYRVLMSADLPMRERRGFLRARGFSFKKEASTYGFQETLKVQTTRVIPPAVSSEHPQLSVRVNEIPAQGQIVHLGEPDHLGIQIQRLGNEVRIFPRLCSHEGACLDTTSIIGDDITCPWHGRRYTPCLKINVANDTDRQVYDDELRRIVYDKGAISVYAVSRSTN